jgi:hypothetical protein
MLGEVRMLAVGLIVGFPASLAVGEIKLQRVAIAEPLQHTPELNLPLYQPIYTKYIQLK